MTELLEALNKVQPLGLAALLALIIYMQVKNQRNVKQVKQDVEHVSGNHLSGLPSMEADVRELVVTMKANNALLQAINSNTIYIRARLNGRDSQQE